MHILGYYWHNDRPYLRAIEGQALKRIDLIGNSITWRIGPRICVGYHDSSGWHACPDSAEVKSARCDSCKSRDSFYYCLKCNGSSCINPKRRDVCRKEEYVIYLAVFGHILKVGITQTFRKRTRWLEQGADFAAEIGYATDGLLARKIESSISKRIRITDRVNGREKLSMLFSDPNISLSMLKKAIEMLHVPDYVIHDFRESYGLENIKSEPRLVELGKGKIIKGKVVAVKGNLMVVESPTGYEAVNLHSLKGRLVYEENGLSEF